MPLGFTIIERAIKSAAEQVYDLAMAVARNPHAQPVWRTRCVGHAQALRPCCCAYAVGAGPTSESRNEQKAGRHPPLRQRRGPRFLRAVRGLLRDATERAETPRGVVAVRNLSRRRNEEPGRR